MRRSKSFSLHLLGLRVSHRVVLLKASVHCDAGPARVYTMRGKYRQFFLRVHDDESNEVYPANLSVSEERTLEVVVETVRHSWHYVSSLPLKKYMYDS